MRRYLTCAVLLTASCSSAGPAIAPPLSPFVSVLTSVLPERYVDCGITIAPAHGSPPLDAAAAEQAQKQQLAVESCATAAFRAHRAFIVTRRISGTNSTQVQMLMENEDGEVFSVLSRTGPRTCTGSPD